MGIKNKKILITCGPTWVPIDDTRVVSNISSGELGHLLAENLKKASAQVTLLEGPVTSSLKSNSIKIIKYRYYDELFGLLKKELKKKYAAVIHAAAVSDYQPSKTFQVKISSSLESLTLNLIPTKKIINLIKKINPNVFLIGFKLESTINQKSALKKAAKLIRNANCDAVVVNSLKNKKYSAFLVDRNLRILNHSQTKKEISKNITQLLKEKLR